MEINGGNKMTYSYERNVSFGGELNCYWESEDLKPRFKKGDAGVDLKAKEKHIIKPGENVTIDTGFYIEIPFGLFGLLVPRSSMGKKGLRLRNTIGVVDFGYHDPVMALAENVSDESLTIEHGERFCQIILIPHFVVDSLNFKESFNEKDNRGGGFGSTGRN